MNISLSFLGKASPASRPNRISPWITALVAGLIGNALPSAKAQTSLTWDGTGADDNWSTSANWGGTAPSANEILNFGGTTRLGPINDLVSYGGYRIFFNSGAGAFTLSGNNFTLFDFGGAAPKIENNSSNLQIINNNITLQGASGSGVEINPVDGNLTFGGALTLSGVGNSTLKVYGNNGNMVTFNGAIGESGSNGFSLLQNSIAVFGAANTYTGTTLVDAGTLRLAAGGSITTSAIQVGTGATFDVNGQTATVKSISEQGSADGGSIKLGSGSLTVNNAGAGTKFFNNLGVTGDTGNFTLNSTGSTLELYGTSLYTGTTTVQAGTLNLQGTATMASSAYILSGGGLTLLGSNLLDNAASMTLSGGTFTIGTQSETLGTLTLQSGSIVGTSGILTASAYNVESGSISAILAGSSGLSKSTAGTVTLSGVNTYSGQTAVSGGVLSFNSAAALGDSSATNTLALSGGATLTSTGATVVLGTNRTLALGAGGGIIDVGANTLTVDGVMSGSTALTKNGTGTLILSGANTYTGDITSNFGIVRASSANGLGTAGFIEVKNTTVAGGTGNTVDLSDLVVTNAGKTLILNATNTGNFRTSLTTSGDATWAGPVTLQGDGPTGFYSNTAAKTLTIGGNVTAVTPSATSLLFLRGAGNGVVTGTLNLGITNIAKTDAGTWTINSAGGTWGNTGVSVGTLKLGIASSLPSTSVVTLGQNDASAATLDLNGFSQTIGGLVSNPTAVGANTSGKTVTSLTAATLTINQAVDGTYAGLITGGLNLIKQGAGVLTLANTGNTFTGAVTVDGSTSILAVPGNAGAVGDPTALGSGSKAINLINGGTIRLTSNSNPTNTNTKMFTIGTGGGKIDAPTGITITLDDNTGATAQLQGTGDLTKVGVGTLQLGYSGQAAGGFSGFTGNIIVSAGTLQAGNLDALGSTVTGTTTVLSGAALDFYSTTFSIAEPLTINGTGISNGGALINSSANAITASGTVAMGSNSSIGGNGAGALTLSGLVSGPGFSLTKVGTVTVILSNAANSYSGGTIVSGGILRPTVAGALPSGALTVNGGGTLDLATNNLNYTPTSLTFGGIAGTAGITTGTGTLTLASDVTYDATSNPGTATVSGKLDLGGADRTFTVADSSNSTTELTVAAVLSGANGINKTGPGVLALTTASGNTFTGGTPASAILVNQGAVAFTADNQLGALANGITLNGGTLSQNGTASTPTLSSLRVITLGASNGTIDIQGVASANKIILTTAGQLAGSGNLTKTGGGTFQLGAANATFSGNWAINGGYVEVQNANALGSGSVTLNTGGELVDSNSVILAKNITLAGGTISSNTTGAFSGTITVSSPSIIAARQFHATANGNSVNLTGTLTGSGNLTITGPTAGSGTVFLTGANTSGYTGGITINPFANLQLGGTGLLANNNALTLNGGTVSFLADGDGTGTPASITTFSDNISVTSSSSITVGRLGTTFAPLFTQALNKTVTLGGTFSIVGQTLTINNNNGYGLSIPASLALTGTPQFSIATTTASDVVPGLTLGGQITGGFGLIKGGVGTMVLSNATNSFTGGLSVTGGVLAATSNAALGNTANGITLNGASAAFAAFESFSTARAFTFSNATAANNLINVSSGKTLTITSAFSGANGFQKGDPGILVLSGANGLYTPAWTVSGGILRLTTTAASGSGAITIAGNSGTALQLDGSGGAIALPNALSIGATTGVNSGGALQNFAGTNSVAGTITLTGAASIGSLAGTLNLGTVTAGANVLTLAGAGNGSASLFTSTGGLTKIGTGNWTIGGTSAFSGTTFQVLQGTLTLSDSGVYNGVSTPILSQAGTIVLDNTATNNNNRFNGRFSNMWFAGELRILGNAAAATTEATGGAANFTPAGSAGTITLIPNALQAITFGSATTFPISRQTTSTLLFRGTNLGSLSAANVANIKFSTGTAATGQAGAASTVNRGINPWALVDTSAAGFGISLAAYDATNGYQTLTAGLDTSPTLPTFASIIPIPNVRTAAGLNATAPLTINSLTLASGGGLAILPGVTVSLDSGAVLGLTGNTGIGTDSRGILSTTGNKELIMHVVDPTTGSGASLAVGATLAGFTGGMIKADGGSLSLNTRAFYTGQTTVNGGLLTLNGGNNTLLPGQNLALNFGGTLGLGTNSQLVGDLFTAATGGGEAVQGGGNVTSGAGATLVVNQSNTARTYAGVMSGPLYFSRAGQSTLTLTKDNSFTGGLLLTGGTTQLLDSGKLSGLTVSTPIEINYAGLQINNTGLLNDFDRIPDAVPINLRGGVITFNGRAQTASAETLGALSLVQGWNNIAVTAGGTGINSADLAFASLSRPVGSAATINFTNVAGNLTANGQIGSAPRLLFTAAPTTTNNLIGPWAFIVREWASYIPGLGVGGLNAAGFAGYSTNTLATGSATDNIKITNTAVTLSANATVNSLINNWSSNVNGTTDLGGNTLTLQGGALMLTTGTDTTTGSINNGFVTSGLPTVGGDLYVNFTPFAGTNRKGSFGAVIADNGVGGTVRLVVTSTEAAGTAQSVTLNALNTYTGGTVVNGGTLNIGATGTLPGNGLTLNAAALTQTAGGVINNTNVVTFNGPSAMTLVGNNTLDSLVFNNNGGVTNPTATSGGVLSLSNATPISVVLPSNPSTVATVAGTLDFANASKTVLVDPITVNGQAVAPLTAGLNITALIQNSGLITKSGNGNLQLSNTLNAFAGGVTVSAGGLIIGGNSVGSTPLGQPAGSLVVSGPVGTGTLTVASGAALLSTAANTLGNASSFGGSAIFDGLNNLTLNGATALTASTAFTVMAPQMTATLGGAISGSGFGITKNGLGVLALANNSNTFTGGVTVNSGTLLATGAKPFGSGVVTISGGLLSLKNNAGANFGNDVTIDPALTRAFIDINNNGNAASVGNTFLFGNLNSQVGTILDVSGGNGYRLQFTGTNLTAAGTPASFSPAAGLTVILPGGFNDANRPVNIGQGVLAFGGTNTFTGATTITGTQGAAPQANAISSPYGVGNNVSLSNGSTLQITPTANTLSATGYTQGGLTGRIFSFASAPSLNAITGSGLMPGAVVGGIPSSDTNTFNHPPGINTTNGTAPAQDIEHYVGSLNIAAGGAYSFALNADDQAVIFVDGLKIVGLRDTGGNGGYSVGFNTGAINLSAGLHSIVVMHQNGGGGSGFQLMYSGPDTSAVPGGGWQNIAKDNLYYTTANPTAGNGYLNAAQLNNAVVLGAGNSATIDGVGSHYNSTVASLNLGNGSTLTVNNAEGTGFIGSIGTTTLGTGVTINTNSGMLNLIGGVTDSGNGLTKTGTASLILGAIPSTAFTGPLTVKNGTVVVGATNALTTGTTTIGDPTVTTVAVGNTIPVATAGTAFTVTVASTTGLLPGMGITGTGIGANAVIVSITNATSYVAASPNATTASTNALTYFNGASLDLNGLSSGPGTIVLNGNGLPLAFPATGALYNSAATAASVSGSVNIGAAINARNPTIGGYGDIAISGALGETVVGQAWSKNGPNTLTLAGNNTFTGALTVNAGILKLGSVNSLGTSVTNGVTFVTNASALDLAGQSPAAAKTLTFGAGNLGITGLAINNTLGALVNNTAATTSTYTGSLSWTGALGIGSSSYDSAAPGGDIILSGTLGTAAGGIGINKVGQNTLTITGLVPTTTGGHNIQMGTLVVSGTVGAFSGGGPLNISSGATVRLDNTAGNVAAGRLGAGANGETINGNLTIIGNSNAAGTTELISTAAKTLAFANSGSVITLQPSATSGGLLFNVSSGTVFARTAGATSLWRGNGLGTATLAAAAATTNTAGFGVGALANPGYSGNQTANTGLNRGVLAWALIDQTNTGLGTSLVTYDTTNGFQPLNFATSGQTDTFATINANTLLTTSISTIANTGQQYLNSLTLNNPTTPIVVTVGAGTTLPLISGGLLNLTGTVLNPNTIAGPGTLSVFNNTELIIHSVGTSVLNITAQIANATGGLTKADAGRVILGAQQLYTGNTIINGGTLQLAGGNNRIFITPNAGQTPGNANFTTSGQVLQVNQGGTLDLNGTTQMFANVNSANTLPNTGGIVTNSNLTASTFQTVLNANQTFAGTLTGNLNFVRSSGFTLTMNSASSYTGTTTIQGGQTILQDLGALTNGITGTSGIFLNGGALTWTDTGSQAVTNRLPAAAPVTFNTGAFTYNARNGVQGAISIGNAAFNSGSSLITLTPNNGGANLTIGTGAGASLTRSVGSAVTFFSGGTGGGIGDHTHVYLGSTPAQPNGIIGAWATAYQNDSFIGQSTQPGFAIYTANGIQTLNPNLVTLVTGAIPSGVNGRMNANITLNAAGLTLNTLTVTTASSLIFTNNTDTLTLTTGGLLTNGTLNLGLTTPNFGQVTAGAGQSELFLHSGSAILTMNARIIDNGVGGGLNVVADPMAGNGTLVLTGVNTYLGTTYLNNINTTLNATGGPAIPGNLVITGGVSALDSLNATTTFGQSNQIATTSTVTLKGGATLNLAGFNNTIANLVLDNTSGDLSGVGGTVQTGGGVLTISGGITETANNNGFLVPQINGNLVLTNAAPTINIAANSTNPNLVGLDLAAAVSLTAPTTTPLILTGGGVIAINGQSSFANGTNVTAGTTLAFGPAAATTGTAATFGAIASSPVNLASGTFLDLRGNAGAIGSLSGSGTVTNLSLTGNTLTTGGDSLADTAFSGTFTNPFVQGLLSLTKIGTKTMTLSADSIAPNLNSPNLGTLTVGGGGLALNSAARISFATNTLNSDGTVTLDNSASPVSNRLGGQFLLVSPTVATPTTTTRILNMQGGTLNILGNNGTTITEGIGQFNHGNGGTVTLNSTSTSGVTLSVVNFGSQGGQTSLLVQGDNLGKNAVNTANSSNFTISGTFAIPGTTGGGAANTTNMTVRGDLIALDTFSGVAGFATKDVNGLRPLNQTTELLNSTATLTTGAVAAATAFNLGLSATSPLATIRQNSGANTLTLLSGGGLGNGFGATGGKFGPAGLQTLTLSNAGILALSGNTGVNIGAVTSAGITFDLHVLGAATTLNFNSSIINTTQGIVKAGDGTVTFSQPQFFTGVNGTNGLAINGGKVVLGGGANTVVVQPTGSVPTLQSLFLNTGTLDLNGNSQAFERIASINTAPGQTNNIITSTAAANLITVPASGVTTTYSGSIGGAISLFKEGAGGTTGTLILTNSNSYTGTTNVVGGTLALRDSGAITGPGAININYGQLLLDNTGLSSSTTRIPVGSAINLNGGTFSVAARQAVESQNIGTVTLAQGLNQISLSQYNNNAVTGSYSLNVANLVQTNNAIINFPNNAGVTLGQTSGNPHVFLTQVNGANFTASNLTNGIIGGWAISNGTDFSSYTNVGGVTALGSGISGVAAYSATALGAGVAADNISLNATVQNVTARTINSLAVRAPGATTTIALSGTDILNIGTGGLLINTAQTVGVQGGRLTAGGATAAPASLYIWSNGAGLQQINTPIVNNGANAVTLVRSGGGTLNLQPYIVQTTTPTATTSLTVQNAADLFVGMTVTGTGFSGQSITAIAGNVLTLSAASTAGTNIQTVFTPPAIAASTTTVGSTAVTLGSAAPAGIVVGMAVGGPNIPGGTTVAAVSGTSLTLSQPAIISGAANATITIGAPSNTYTGGTINNGGNGIFGAINLTGLPGSVVIPGDLTIGNAGVNMVTNQGQIARTSNVTWVSGGTLTLVGTNTLNSLTFNGNGTSGGTGTASIGIGAAGSGASLSLSAANAITATNNDLGHTPVINGLSLSLTNAAPVISTSGLSPTDLIINAPIISAGGTLTKSGTGSVILNPTTGALTVTNTINTNVVTIATGTLGLAVGQSVAGTGVPAGATIASITSPTTFTLSAVTTAAATSVTVTGSTFTNGVNLNQGSIIFGTNSVGTPPATTNGPIGTGTFTLSGGTAGSTILSDGTARIIGNAVSVTGGGFTFGGTLAGNNTTLSGIVTLGAGANSINVTSPLVTGTISGQLTGGTNLTKTGNGILTLSNVTNNYGGTTAISGGALKVGVAGAIPDASAVTVSAGAVLDLNDFDETIGSLAGAGLATNSSANQKTLTVGSNDTSTTFSGSIATANVHLTKIGAGTLTLTGNNTIGNVNVTRGNGTNSILEFAGSGTSTAATVFVGLSGTGTAILNIKDTHTLTAANFSVGDQSTHAGTVNQSGGAVTATGTFKIGHWPNATSFYNLSSGSLSLTGTPGGVVNQAGAAEQNGVLYIGIDGTGEFAMSGGTASANAIVLDGRVATTGTDKFTVTGGVFTIGANGIKAGSLDLAANIASMQINLGGGTLAASAAWTSTLPMTLTGTGGDITFDTSGTTIGLSGVLSGTGGLKKAGAGTQTLSGASTYSGGTAINAGTLAAGVASAANVSGAFGNNSAVTFANVAGATMNITGFNTQVGSLTGGGALGGNITLGAATLTTGGDNTSPAAYAGLISGTGGLTKIGTGTQTLTAANTYTGVTNVTGGTLALGGSGSIADTNLINLAASGSSFDISAITGPSEIIGSITSVSGSSIKLGANLLDIGGDNTTFSSSGDISGPGGGSITKSGTGVMTLGGNNTYSGNTNVAGGTLLLATATALPSSAALNLSTGTTLSTGGFNQSTGVLSVGGTAPGTGAIIDMAGGTAELTFASVGTWTGLLSVWNYSGAAWTLGTDKLTFTTGGGSINLANVQFYSDNGVNVIGTGGGGLIGSELVPVPEASTASAALLLLGALGFRERRRLLHFRK